MKKLSIFFAFALLVFAISCNNEDTNLSPVDFSELPKSKLKSLINNSEEVKLYLKKKLEKRIEREIDTPPDDGGGCYAAQIKRVSDERLMERTASRIEYSSEIEVFNDETREFRDEVLSSGSTGQVYIDAYYHVSENIIKENVTLIDVAKFTEVMPTVKTVYEKLKSNNYQGVVLSEAQKNEVFKFIDFVRGKLNNSEIDRQILDAVKSDISGLTNRNPTQIREFIQQ